MLFNLFEKRPEDINGYNAMSYKHFWANMETGTIIPVENNTTYAKEAAKEADTIGINILDKSEEEIIYETLNQGWVKFNISSASKIEAINVKQLYYAIQWITEQVTLSKLFAVVRYGVPHDDINVYLLDGEQIQEYLQTKFLNSMTKVS